MAEALVRTSLQAGRYEGVLTGAGQTEIEALHKGRIVGVAQVTAHPTEAGAMHVALNLPPDVLSDGVQVVGLRSTASGEVLDRVTLMAGSALDEDIRGEVSLLREELEMLKRAFRRHCAETGQD
ncbi:hypothetical protein [Gymnodinialimonas ceratoperidinii]|uniref:Uncharacterized protein n=1 Tax=Gymnodinialimonas ceratoperidinii TaxID=2856823 RepID=A0A8F6TXG0_9RHOB|nr:hypothetical protein [Gymnodinialimonas ceratoperidinii]QXT39934.1 hypothetical protein KYE46_01330 [Gymnodinialimonas ceratoperidinii]